MEMLKIATAGSVDDGKSTLIGRLLYDTRSIAQDKLEAIERASRRKGIEYLDLSLLTDGLIAEREQGITIDVAHIYFSTPRRKYIIADTPGHVEYTRNMVTGASGADVSLILVDVRNGVVEQTRRHLYIASLLRVPRVVLCINKMDLADYAQPAFEAVVQAVESLLEALPMPGRELCFIPVSSLWGDNVAHPSAHMPWYEGPSLLSYLESLESPPEAQALPGRFPVQYVIRPRSEAYHDYRAYAGRVSSGRFALGDEVMVLPSGQRSRISRIQRYEQDLAEALPGQSLSISLDDDLDIGRGDLIVRPEEAPRPLQGLEADLCWMEREALAPGKILLLQQGPSLSKVKVQALISRVDTASGEEEPAPLRFQLNDIGRVSLRLARPLFADPYALNPANGAFVLIDEFTNNTVAVGFVREHEA
jgi:sulfate adenylyltransferase subunit 1